MLLASWNLNGIRALGKNKLVKFLSNYSVDVLSVQEIKANKEVLRNFNINGYYSYWNPANRSGYSGTGVYTKIKPLSVNIGMDFDGHDEEGRVLNLEFKDFYLINAYFPHSQRGLGRLDFKMKFNKLFFKYVQKLRKNKSVIICGDLNVAHKEIDLKNPKKNKNNAGFLEIERSWLSKLLSAGYIDTFREFNQSGDQYTWWSYMHKARERNIGWRIDYFIISKDLKSRLINSKILSNIMGSDHSPIFMTLKD